MNFYLNSMVALALLFLPQVAEADMNLFNRLLFSDKAYSKKIEVKAYIITQEQARAALCNPLKDPVQLDKKELYGKKTYLLLRVRNTELKHAWGILNCKILPHPNPLRVSIGDLVSKSDEYNTYLLQIGSLELLPNETGTPEVLIGWDELYTK